MLIGNVDRSCPEHVYYYLIERKALFLYAISPENMIGKRLLLMGYDQFCMIEG